MKRKCFLLGMSALTTLGIVVAMFFAGNKTVRLSSMVRGDDDPLVLDLSRSVTASEISAGAASFNTVNGNPITFKFSSASTDSGLISLATGGDFYNQKEITGITRIRGTISGGSGTLSYGNHPDSLKVGSQALDTSGNPFVINLTAPSDYFKISVASGPMSIENLEVTYACSNTYSYAQAREEASDDLFYLSTLEQSFSWAYVADRQCLDVANSDSGYSFHLTVNSSASGWPTWNYNLGSPIGTENFDIEFYAKGIDHTSYNLMLLDSSNANILSGNMSFEVTETWQKITLATFNVASGKNLADVQKIKLSANYGSSAGTERHLYLDQLRFLIPENPSRLNLEMVEYTRASTTQTALASFDFDERYGVSSTCSRKLDFATATGFGSSSSSTYRAFATFNIEASLGADNGIDAKNCTLSFDIKFSDAILNSEDTRIGTPTLDVTDSAGTSATLWNISFSATSGWIHFSKNLSGSLTSLNGNTKTLRFGFYGIYTGNQSEAVINIDNLALTAN